MTSPYTDADLEAMLTDIESDLLECKRSAADTTKIRRNICAFANDLPNHARPGVILVGIENDGRCANAIVDDPLLQKLAQARSDGNIQPLPSLIVQKRVVNGCTVAAIFVEPSQAPPVRYKGRVWVKVGPTVAQATREEEQRLAERRRAADLPFDLQPASEATLDDLDLEYIRAQYLPRAVADEVLQRNERSQPEQLRSLRLSLGDRPLRGALLAFGRDPLLWLPGAYVQFLRIDGDGITDPIRNQKVMTGKLEDVLRQVAEMIELTVSVRTDVASASRELRFPDYPVEALRQFTYNAIMHRNYEGSNSPVRIYWYNDRVEIQSPGGLYGTVTAQNIFEGVTDYRNPLVAEIMHNLGYAQRFGLGVRLAQDALSENGNPGANFDFRPGHVGVTVRATGTA